MPAMLPAAAATTALGTGAAVGAGVGALGTGLALGTKLAGGAGIFSNFMAGAAPTLTGGLGTLAPAVVAKVAPAAASQLAGTIGANAAPSMLQSAGLEALKGKVIGAGVQNAAAQQATNLAFQNAAAQNMAGGLAKFAPQAAGYNPAIAQNLAPKFLANSPPIADPNNPLLRSSVANYDKPYLAQNAVISDAPAKVAPELLNTATRSPYDLSAGLRTGADPRFAGQQGIQTATGPTVDPTSIVGKGIRPNQNFLQNLGNIGSFQDVKDYVSEHPYATAGVAALAAKKLFEQKGVKEPESKAMIRPYTYERTQNPEAYAVSPTQDSSERLYFNDQFNAGEPYKAADGGIVSLAVGGPVEQMAAMNSVGMNTGYPQANLQTPMYSNPTMQRPEATNVIAPSAGAGVGTYSGEARFADGGETQYGNRVLGTNPTPINSENYTRSELAGGRRPSSTAPTAPLPVYSYDPKTMQFTQTGGGSRVSGGIANPAMGPMQAQQATPINVPAYQTPEQQLGLGGFYDYMNQQLGGYGGYAAGGGVSTLGDYSDGGRLLRGPGDGVSDSIPASIGNRQPARLADGEFVVPARIVSELGNGSTEAGARKLYAMMDRVQKARKKSVGKNKVAVDSKTDKHLPA